MAKTQPKHFFEACEDLRLRTRGKGEEETVGLILMFRKEHRGELRACFGIGCKYSSCHPISKASFPSLVP